MSATIIRFGEAVMAIGRTKDNETKAVVGIAPFPVTADAGPPVDARYAAALKKQREQQNKGD